MRRARAILIAAACLAHRSGDRRCRRCAGGGEPPYPVRALVRATASIRQRAFLQHDGRPGRRHAREVIRRHPDRAQRHAPGRVRYRRLPLVVISHGWGGPARTSRSRRRGPRAATPCWRSMPADSTTPAGRHSLASPIQPAAHTGGSSSTTRDTSCATSSTSSGLLVDEGFVNPVRIGLYGWSYGGVVSLEGAILKDRVMYRDGSLHPWRSPNGIPMRIAAASPRCRGAISPTRCCRTAGRSTTRSPGRTTTLRPSGFSNSRSWASCSRSASGAATSLHPAPTLASIRPHGRRSSVPASP